MLEIKVDTSGLENAIAEFAKASGKDLSAVMRLAGGTMVGQLIGVTPPAHQKTLSGDGGATLAAKKAGESRVGADIAKLFPVTKIKKDSDVEGMVEAGFKWEAANGRRYAVGSFANSLADLKRIHQSARNPQTGRPRISGGSNMAVTRSAIRAAYIKQAIKKVGMLSAGWLNAARELKTSARYLPAWIKRHGAGPGGAHVTEASNRVSIRIYNSNAWFGPGWDRRLAYVLSRGEKAMISGARNILLKNAKAAERRMGR